MGVNCIKKSSKRISELDALRGLAALSVVVFHFTYGYDNGLNILTKDHFYFRYGYLGVQLFFIISGFVILMTLNKTKSTKGFVISRFSRLYPAYWVAITLTVLFSLIMNIPFQQGIYSLKQVLVNFTMLQYWLKVDHVDGAYRTLSIELTFYVLMWIVYFIGKLNKIVWFGFGWLALSVIFYSFDLPLDRYVKILLILNHAPMFVAGIGFYKLHNNTDLTISKLLIFFSLIIEFYLLKLLKTPLPPYIIIFIFYIVFYLFVINKLRFLSNKILLFLGSISYSLYLIHQNIGEGIIYWVKKVYDYQCVYVPIAMVIVILLAWLITKYIEQPSLKLIRQKISNN